MERLASMRNCLLAIVVLTSIGSWGQGCQSGDCQPGTIAGPFMAAQTAENTVANFPRCEGSLCGKKSWYKNQIEGIDAKENLGTPYRFYDEVLNMDTNIAVGPNVTKGKAQILQWVDPGDIQAFDKKTGKPIYGSAKGTTQEPRVVFNLWSHSTQPECQVGSGNVQVIFDRLDNEFAINRRVTYEVGGIAHYAWCVALSSSSDLSKGISWYAYEFKMDSAIPCLPQSNNCTTGTNYYYFPDWPRIGTGANGFYITFDLTDPTFFYYQLGFEACQLDRADMARGLPANPMTCYTYTVPESDNISLIHSVDEIGR